jgi:hypothetical protein
MEQAQQFSERLFLSTGQAARHCQASIPALKRWIRDGWLVAFKTPEGHCRKELEGLQRSLRQYGILLCLISELCICILISDENPSIAKLFADILADDLRGFHLDPPTDGYDALIKVDMVRPSLLILDVFIPCLDGIAVCRCLKANLDTRTIKILRKLMRVWPNRFGSGMCGLSWQSIRVLVWPVVPTGEQPTAGEDMNANGLPQHLAEVEDDDMLDAAAHQWLKRDIFTRTHVVGQSSECPQEWKSVSIP